MFLLAFFLPPFAVFACGKPIQGAINLCIWGASFPLLLLGGIPGILAWLIAFIHAASVYKNRRMTKQVNAIAGAIRESSHALQMPAREVPRAASSQARGDRRTSFDFTWTPSHSDPEPETSSGDSGASMTEASGTPVPADEEVDALTSFSLNFRDAVQEPIPASKHRPQSSDATYGPGAASREAPQILHRAPKEQSESPGAMTDHSGARRPGWRRADKRDGRHLRLATVMLAYVFLGAALVLFVPEVRTQAIGLWAELQASAMSSRAFAEAHSVLLLEIAALIGIGGVFAVAARTRISGVPGFAICLLLIGYLTYAELGHGRKPESAPPVAALPKVADEPAPANFGTPRPVKTEAFPRSDEKRDAAPSQAPAAPAAPAVVEQPEPSVPRAVLNTFAVQLAAPLSEREGNDETTALIGRCPVLKSAFITMLPAKINSVMRYQVRLQRQTLTDADNWCNAIRAEGCACWVIREQS